MKSTNNNNKTSAPIRKLHNPKAHTPAVYIPCWLIQVPDSKLSLGAKMVYGRLAQWSNTKGQVHRSSTQLSHELGMSKSPVDRYIKELKNVGLIGTYQASKGGVNYFEFYDHEWMYEPIHPNLCYADPIPKQVFDPIPKETIPYVDIDIPPMSKQTNLKYNKIKTNKDLKRRQSNKSITAMGNDNCAGTKKPFPFEIEDMLADNPHELNEAVVLDWVNNRKSKRNKVTLTAWKRINKNLTLIRKELGISPNEAFETMVAAGWVSLELKYFENRSKGNGGKESQGSGIKDSNGNDITWD